MSTFVDMDRSNDVKVANTMEDSSRSSLLIGCSNSSGMQQRTSSFTPDSLEPLPTKRQKNSNTYDSLDNMPNARHKFSMEDSSDPLMPNARQIYSTNDNWNPRKLTENEQSQNCNYGLSHTHPDV